ncbi:MAG: hypothetical protein NZL87_08765, partial [Thermomicrobium sp.]|nr:hypothetical protein [Thermomicrobium sp.]
MKKTRAIRLRRSWVSVISLIGLASSTSGCGVIGGKIASTSDPAGDQARHIWDLFVVPVWWLSVAVFLLVTVWMLLNIVLFRRKPGDTRIPAQVHGNPRLEIAWTLVPAAILAALAVFNVRTLWALERDTDAATTTVEVRGQQWWWEFRYDLDEDGEVDIIT